MTMFYTPPSGRAGDVIPFYANGRFHVFYLLVDEKPNAWGSVWAHISSKDLVTWTEHPVAIPRGNPKAPDASVATGSIVERNGVYRAFYTGFETDERKAEGFPWQTVMSATSVDLDHWARDKNFLPLNADTCRYAKDDWRDPYVFFNEEAGEYWMLVAGQSRLGPMNRRGLLARYHSVDLVHWKLLDPLWAPHECVAHECPDLFRMGDWWYLLYSPISDRQITRYRMSHSLDGPWIAPDDDALDDDGLYAAKTMSDGKRRYLVGWIATNNPANDEGTYQWGGTLAVHELRQREDGSLAVFTPKEVRKSMAIQLPEHPESGLGVWDIKRGKQSIVLDSAAADCFQWARLGDLSASGSVAVDIDFDRDVHEVGVMFRVDEHLDKGYLIRVLPRIGRIEFDYFPRVAFRSALHDRPLPLVGRSSVKLDITWDQQTVVVSIDNLIVMSARTYQLFNQWGVFVEEGKARFAITPIRNEK